MPRSAGRRATEPTADVLFAALGDPTRLSIVRQLCDGGPMSIARIAEGSHVTRQAVSKHLRVLERAGFLQQERRGREVEWRLEQRRIEVARQHLDRISKQWDDALSRLRALVES